MYYYKNSKKQFWKYINIIVLLQKLIFILILCISTNGKKFVEKSI